MSKANVNKIEGTFKIIDWKESTLESFADGSKFTEAKVKQQYSGAIVGEGELRYQMFYGPDGNASFIGYELLDATLDSEKIAWVIEHKGYFKNGIARSECVVKRDVSGKKHAFYVGGGESGKECEADYYFE